MPNDVNRIRTLRSKIRILEREMEKTLLSTTSCCGVTLSQCHILLELEKSGKTSIKNLAQVLDLDKSTLSRTVDGLVNLGLIDRRINPEDRRFMNISLTNNGEAAADRINALSDKYYSDILSHIPDAKHDSVLEGIALFSDAMQALKKK